MRITRERHVYSLGVSEPVATVTAPCSLTVETCDCFNGQVTKRMSGMFFDFKRYGNLVP